MRTFEKKTPLITIICMVVIIVLSFFWILFGSTNRVMKDNQTPHTLNKVQATQNLLSINYNRDSMVGKQSSFMSDQVGQLLIDKDAYPSSKIHRGDVVYFEIPNDDRKSNELANEEISRVVALPGEFFKVKHGQIYINNKKLDAFYGKMLAWGQDEREYFSSVNQPGAAECNSECEKTMKEYFNKNIHELQVPDNQIFLLSDNALRSRDSQIFGPLPIRNVIGKVVGSKGKG